ncbi:MAG: FAD:protein FMN transferase [Planctomycetota bacterium]
MIRTKRAAAWISAAILFASCQQEPLAIRAFAGPTMGSSYEVKFAARLPLAEVRSIVTSELRAFDLAFSNWRDDSEIARLNAIRSTEPLALTPRFAEVLTEALKVAAATDGAFDPTLKPLSTLYRRAKDGEPEALARASVDAACQRVGYQLVRVVDGKLIKKRADVELDLDGIVAGAAADAIGARLRKAGVMSYYLQITGEVLCHGRKPNGDAWRIGVVDPDSDRLGGDRAVRSLPLQDRSLCSSGDYRNAVIVEGRVVHHVFDPRTGRNPEHTVVSASVLADRCAVADAVGTALMVAGDAEVEALYAKLVPLGVHGLLLLKPGEEKRWQQVEVQWPSGEGGEGAQGREDR